MNKKLIAIVLLITFVTVGYAQDKKIAVVTFYANKAIGTDELGGAASLAASILTLAEDPSFDLQPTLNNFHDKFFGEYVEVFPFAVIPEEEVTSNADYQAYESAWGDTGDQDRVSFLQRFVVYDGYKPMTEVLLGGKKKNHLQMLKIFPDVDGVMFVWLDYNFVKKALGFAAGIQAYAKIKLWNKEGKKVFAINEYATSKKDVPMIAGVPATDIDKILPMCEDATEQLMKDLGGRVEKIAKKSAKKL